MEEDLKCTVKHPDIIEKVKKTMPDEETLFDIADLLNMTQSAISHQLRVLKQAKLVKFRKDGKTVYYSLSDEHVEMIFNMALEHIKEM